MIAQTPSIMPGSGSRELVTRDHDHDLVVLYRIDYLPLVQQAKPGYQQLAVQLQ